MNLGDLVNLYAYSPHDAELANTVLHTGILVDWEYEEPDGGWKVLVDGKIETFTKMWWVCRATRENQ